MAARKVQGSTWLCLALWLVAVVAGAAEPAAPDEHANWRVWLEPKFMKAPITAPITGSQRTQLAAGMVEGGELQILSRESFEKLGVNWEDFSAKARENAATDLQSLKPEYTRNRKQVIQYAILRSERPIVAAAVMAPRFLNLFADTLGPKVFVVVPSRYVAIVFPALASNYREYSPLVFREYRETAYPVSVEVFEFSPTGIRAIGAYEE